MQIRLCLQVWLTDKDRAEKSAIKEVIPDCDQFLCSFHVLQSFRRELNLASVEKGEPELAVRAKELAGREYAGTPDATPSERSRSEAH